MKPGAVWPRAICAGVILLLYPHGGWATYISEGDTVNTLVAELGPPQAIISMETHEVYYFERGKVIVKDGVVASSELISEEQAEQERQKREKRAEYDQMKKLADGLNLKQAKLNDRAFLNQPAVDQLTFWRTYEKSYPEISVDPEFALALQKLALEQEVVRRVKEYERRLNELEKQLAATREQLRLAGSVRPAQQGSVNIIVEAPRSAAPMVVVAPSPEPAYYSYGGYYPYLGPRVFPRIQYPDLKRSGRINTTRKRDHRSDQASSVFRPPLPPMVRTPHF